MSNPETALNALEMLRLGAAAVLELERVTAENARLRRGWLRVIQMENSCPATGGGYFAKRCGCVEEMEMLANEAALTPEVKP